ncbi:cysteine-rich venom protein Mr30-like [Mya arenaria]|uniref:cysteine-rich venom protein Mr30-like n=1 Tax=Mya arenaria TaxID=6604 RepID=UPI0022E8A80F|nr:cysteine-rich venom protein Mr30-like [Mya arenaria]
MAESASFTYNGTANNNDRVGNYTQMISGPTTGLGCAVSDCHGYFLYMCLYVPILNPADIDTPYKVAKQPCSDCPTHCNTTANLCNCNGVLCLGGSKLNVTTCVCDCITTMGASNMYNGTVCDLSCIGPNGDDHSCGRPPYTNDSCDTNMETMFHCPYMCYVCPYAGQGKVNGEDRLPWEKGLPNCTTTNSTTSSPRTTENKAGIKQSSMYTTTRYTTATDTTVTGSLHNRESSASVVMQDGALSIVFLAWCLSRN